MYGVVRCPRCGRPQGVRLEAKTHRCPCGRRLALGKLRPLFTTEDPRALPAALGRVRAEGMEPRGASLEALEGGTLTRVPAFSARVRRQRALEVLRDLSGDPAGFTETQAREVLGALGLGGEEILESLRRENLLYEVGPGRYRLV